jgi:hypothetical protein
MPLRTMPVFAAVLCCITVLCFGIVLWQLHAAQLKREAFFHAPCRGTLVEGYSGNDPVRLCVPRSP